MIIESIENIKKNFFKDGFVKVKNVFTKKDIKKNL